MEEQAQIEKQLEFVEWLKSHNIYNMFASASTMQNMMLVWEAFKVDRPTPDTGIEWVGECDNPPCDKGRVWHVQSTTATVPMNCPKCNGTGTITRPATLKEVIGQAKDMIKILNSMDNMLGLSQAKQALTINNGRLTLTK